MTPSDKRVAATLKRWLESIDQHVKFVDLNDDEYESKRNWLPHQRPRKDLLMLARKRVVTLAKKLEKEVKAGNKSFSQSLELMRVLSNMVGRESGERFIPLTATDDSIAEAAQKGRAKHPERRDFVRRQELIRLVAADSVRFLSWGREWHELPEVISRLDGRPNEEITRRILKANRAVIEQEAMGGSY
jgi:hypothetical protein